LVPAGSGRFPALIINHGTNLKGTGVSFYTARAGEMGPWGLACIAPDLTHVGTSENLETWGYSPENLARDLACLAALSTRDDIDLNRLAMWGHSRGSFASIGVASVLRNRLKALGFSAGGVLEDTDSNEGSFPSVTEASGITAPTIMFHGTGDGIVLPATSQRLQDLLNTLGTVNYRQLYDTGTQSGSESHNLYSAQNADYLADMLTQWRAWLVTSGVLP
jgi:pimeloyl-ACP methyl ester carboxylesterase